MSVQLNHTIVAARDKETSAKFLAAMLGVPVGPRFGPFVPVEMSNGVTLDFIDTAGEPITTQHYAFLVSENEFDAIFGRIRDAGVAYYADPHHGEPEQINHRDGGRGVYFDDPNGHNLEILTRPYGSGAA
ncbi:VOC family protein [Dactylosporangium sp. NPDC005572]|uniref:VOC family protein n=1 Tax=Dactylosporangium sp. NPDC005572 TaxID=3156889 RepID=UPI0033B6E765